MPMPGTLLISKMCPKNMEATTFAILASFSNLGNALSGSFGVFAMQYAGIKTDVAEDGECDFTNLPTLIVVVMDAGAASRPTADAQCSSRHGHDRPGEGGPGGRRRGGKGGAGGGRADGAAGGRRSQIST